MARRRKRKVNGKPKMETWPSFDAFLDQCEQPSKSANEHMSTLNISGHPPEWFGEGIRSFADAMKLARYGWPEGTAKIRQGLDIAKHLTDSKPIRVLENAIVGFVPSVPDFLIGNPESMLAFSEVNSPVLPILKIEANLTVAGMVKHNTIVNRGIALVSMIDALETAGYQIELVGYIDTAGNDGTHIRQEFPIKSPGMFLELDRFSYILAHPSVLRMLHFRLLEQDAKHATRWYPGYGDCRDTPSEPDNESVIHVPMIRYKGFKTIESSLDNMRKVFTNYLN